MGRIALYGAALAAGALALQWLDFQRAVRADPLEAYLFLIAAGFLLLGLFVGARLFGAAPPLPFEGNSKAQATLGISRRELEILAEIAAGHSNKEIADRLCVSPHTVKTHVARLLEKLDARRRTEAIARARELGLIP